MIILIKELPQRINMIKATDQVTGSFALIDSLVKHEVKHIFGYPAEPYYLFMMNYINGNKKAK